MRSILSCLALLFIVCRLEAQTWNLIWSDEFNGTALDTSNWNVEVNDQGGGNNELQYYTNRPANVKVVAGNLVIEGNKEVYLTRNYTSARLNSKGKRSWTYGKMEARMKLPYGNGMWPAFWMLGDSAIWPNCGEVDIMEMVGGTACSSCSDKTIYGNIHWAGSGGTASAGSNAPPLSAGKYNDAFHVFTVEWNASTIIWLVDSVPYFSYSVAPAALAAFHHPFYILLNLAIGGSWPGSPDATTVWPQDLLVDYVRVYQQSPLGIQEDTRAELTVFPNPASNTLFIRAPTSMFGWNIQVYNLKGQQIGNSFRVEAETQLDVSSMAKGIYYLKLVGEKEIVIKKVVVE
jgi:beta-glucanase (GH16 family)